MAEKSIQVIFRQGEQYHQAALQLSQTNLVLPYTVNAAFALELYLKCLVALERAPNHIPKQHDLFKLFEMLNPETQASLVNDFRMEVAKDPNKASALAEHLGFTDDLWHELGSSKDAFVLFRYAFEGKPARFTVGELIPCLRNYIVKLKPDWKAG